MSFVSIIRVVPTAIRIAIAGGGAYGTVKVGVWNDHERSREKLNDFHESWKEAIKIHPSSVPETKVFRWDLYDKGLTIFPHSTRMRVLLP